MSKSNAGSIHVRSDEPNKIITGSEAQADMLVRRCAEVLQKHYPKYMWHVQISMDNSVVGVRCISIDTQYGYVLHTLQVQSDPDLKCVVNAGGEILERAFVTRGRANADQAPTKFDLTGAKFKKKSHADGVVEVAGHGRIESN